MMGMRNGRRYLAWAAAGVLAAGLLGVWLWLSRPVHPLVPSLTAVVVTRDDINGSSSLFRRVDNPTVVARLYRAILQLPPPPSVPAVLPGSPIDFGITLNLVFYRGAQPVLQAEVHPSGLREVVVNGAVRGTGGHRGSLFWHDLAQALGVSDRRLFGPDL